VPSCRAAALLPFTADAADAALCDALFCFDFRAPPPSLPRLPRLAAFRAPSELFCDMPPGEAPDAERLRQLHALLARARGGAHAAMARAMFYAAGITTRLHKALFDARTDAVARAVLHICRKA